METHVQIHPFKREYAKKFHKCLDDVAKEGLYLMANQAPPLSAIEEDFKNFENTSSPNFYAFDCEKLVGWCDLRLNTRESIKHRSELGMGLLKQYRGQGIGRKLITLVLDSAPKFGLEKVELIVLADNEPAIKLYQSVGFKEEGVIKSYRKMNGQYTDAIQMGLFLNAG